MHSTFILHLLYKTHQHEHQINTIAISGYNSNQLQTRHEPQRQALCLKKNRNTAV